MTEDSDFKKLVRGRMARTGESYTTARAHLLRKAKVGEEQGDAASGATANDSAPEKTTFDMGDGLRRELDRAEIAVSATMRDGEAVLGADELRVVLAGFEADIPYERICDVSAVPDQEVGSNLGVHGLRGRWMVNAAYTGLVRLDIDPPIRAQFKVRDVVERVRTEHGPAPEVPRLLRPLLRNRRPKVRVLVISVTDRDGFIAALRQRCEAARR